MNTPQEPSSAQILKHLRRSNAIALEAIEQGHHPFGALLIGPDNETVLMEQANIDTVNHAESTLARRAAERFDPDYLWQCTLYTAVEPCCMCSGTIYWANIGRVVYGMEERDLLKATGAHHENPTLDISAHYVFSHGQKPVKVMGPIEDVIEETARMQHDFWSQR